jgi:hypothetical protein
MQVCVEANVTKSESTDPSVVPVMLMGAGILGAVKLVSGLFNLGAMQTKGSRPVRTQEESASTSESRDHKSATREQEEEE